MPADGEAWTEYIGDELGAEYGLGIRVANDPPSRQHDEPRGHGPREIQIVQDGGDRQASSARELTNQLQHRYLVSWIEVDRGFVKKEHVGLLGKGHGEHGSLALAARETIDAARFELPEPQIGDRAIHSHPVRRRRASECPEPRGPSERNDLSDGEGEERVEDLRHHRDTASQVTTYECADVDSVEAHDTGAGP